MKIPLPKSHKCAALLHHLYMFKTQICRYVFQTLSTAREDQQICCLRSLENSAKAAYPKINYVEMVHFFAYLLQKHLNKSCNF